MNVDKASGLQPFLVVASVGPIDTGALDPSNELADICEKFKTRYHADAAYGGFFVLLDEQKKLQDIERSDPVVLDP